MPKIHADHQSTPSDTPTTGSSYVFVDGTLKLISTKDDAGVTRNYAALPVSVTSAITGVLPIANGGTNIATYAQGDLLFASAVGVLSALTKDTASTRYLSNTGTSNGPAWAQVSLSSGVTGDLPFANFVQASAASLLVGRGGSAGAGDFQEISLGTGLTFTGTTLYSTVSATPGGSTGSVQFNSGGSFGGFGTYTLGTATLSISSLATSGIILTSVSSAGALSVGPPTSATATLLVDTSTASGATGLSIKNAASGSGVTLTALGGTNENLKLVPKGSGKLRVVNGVGDANYTFEFTGGSKLQLGDNVTDDLYMTIGVYSGVNNIDNKGRNLSIFSTAHADSMTILAASGLVGLGISSPTYGLHLAPTSGLTAGQTAFFQDATASTGKTTVVIKAGAVAGNLLRLQNSAGADKFMVDNNGSISIGAGSGLTFSGTIAVGSVITITSGIVTSIT